MATFVTTVLDHQGKPRAGVLVEIAQTLYEPLRAHTDARGKASFHVRPGVPVIYMRAGARQDPRRLYPVCDSGEEVTLKT